MGAAALCAESGPPREELVSCCRRERPDGDRGACVRQPHAELCGRTQFCRSTDTLELERFSARRRSDPGGADHWQRQTPAPTRRALNGRGRECHHVRRFEIPVDDSSTVQRLDGRQDVDRDRDGLPPAGSARVPGDRRATGRRAAPSPGTARLRAGQSRRADRCAGGQRRPPSSPRAVLGRTSAIGGGHDGLDRDRPLQPFVDGFVHDPHAAASDLSDEAIVPDAIRHGCGCRGVRANAPPVPR